MSYEWVGVSNYDEGEVQMNLFQDPSVQYNIFSETVKTYKMASEVSLVFWPVIMN